MTRQVQAADAVDLFGALAQPTRLEIIRLLVRYRPHGLAAGDIGRLLAVAHNTLSTHLGALERVGLVDSRREGRHIIFAIDSQRAENLRQFLSHAFGGETLLPHQVGAMMPFPARKEATALDWPFTVLVVCTGNSARSIMAEALLNREGLGRVKAFSAGSRPQDAPHPLAIALLDELRYDVSAARSKCWNEFVGPTAPKLDLVITVCDDAADEECPVFPGAPLIVHWGLDDPACIGGPLEARRAAFKRSYRELASRVTAFINLPIEHIDIRDMTSQLSSISLLEGATDKTLQCAA